MTLGGLDEDRHEPYKVPPWTKFSIQRIHEMPELFDYRERLARLGLNDPWIRNYMHLYDPVFPKQFKMGQSGMWLHTWKLVKLGLKPGAAFAGGLIAIEELYSRVRYGHTSWGGAWGEHDEHGHDDDAHEHGHEGTEDVAVH